MAPAALLPNERFLPARNLKCNWLPPGLAAGAPFHRIIACCNLLALANNSVCSFDTMREKMAMGRLLHDAAISFSLRSH